MSGESEFDGVGVNRSGVHSKPPENLEAWEKRMLAVRTGDPNDPEKEPTEMAWHGQDPDREKFFPYDQ